MIRVRLIHWKTEEAERHIAFLRSLGYAVEFNPMSSKIMKSIRQDPPDAIVIDLNRLPSQGRDLGINLRIQKSTRDSTLLFVGGDPVKVSTIQNILPDAIYTSWEDIENVMDDAIANPAASPIVPDSVFAPYKDTPLPKKLGIKNNSHVALIEPPAQIEAILGQLPKGVSLESGIQPADVHLWFVSSQEQLEQHIATMGMLAASGPLWIIWTKKSSKYASDLTQNLVRKTGLEHGLVDYKICSLDKNWSGLCFTQRKE